MMAIILKELRENQRWAMLALLGIMLAMATAVYLGSDPVQRQKAPTWEPVLVQPYLNAVCGFGFPAIGFALGLLVVLEDSGVSRWALLTHRPMTRGRIFFGKVMGAMGMYVVATGVPLAGITAWAAWAAFGPFDWRMVLPRLAQQLAGVSWIGAGMLVGARRARWIGSRLFPAVPALLITAYGQLTETDTLIIVGSLIAGPIVLGIGAYAAFIAGGVFESERRIGRLIETLAVACGVGTILLTAAAIGYELADVIAGVSDRYSYYRLDNTGQLLRYDEDGANGSSVWKWTGERFVPDVDWAKSPESTTESSWLADGGDQRSREQSLFSPTRYVVFVGLEAGRYWYWLPRSRTIVAYDRRGRDRVASLGPDGMRDASQPPQPFPEPIEFTEGCCAVSDHAVWWITPPAKPELLYSVPAGQIIRDFGVIAWQKLPVQKGVNVRPASLAVFVGAKLEIVRLGPRAAEVAEVAEVAVPRHPDEFMQYSFAETPNHGYAIFIFPDNLLIEIAPDGREMARTILPPLPESHDRSESLRDAVAVALSPPAGMWAFAMRAGTKFAWQRAVGSAAVAALAGLLAWLRMRRYAGNSFDRWWWTVLCVVGGVGGLLLLLCTRTAVAMTRCPNCGRRRRVVDAHCPHCRATLGPPARTGVEVFAMSDRLLQAQTEKADAGG